MKILSSDVYLTSRSTYSHTKDETLYALDEKGQVAHKTRNKTQIERETSSTARFKTQGDYTVDIQHTPLSRENVGNTTSTERGGDFDDDLEKNLYLASVFEWAANTIDEVVANFEARKKEQAPNPEIMAAPSTDASKIHSSSQNENISSTDLKLTIYKEVAAGYRLQAKALRPASMNASDDRIRYTKSHEKETTLVQAGGVVHTIDGRKLDFSLTVGMHRENRETKTEAYRLVDPLVINFSGTSAQLEDEKIGFDLDGDGEPDQVSRLGQGSGFLALDLNQDGEVNSGRELFGPSTGDGFQELSFYDRDKNGWIDENDDIYDELMVWIQNDSEKGLLKKLSETGIGAIHLGAVNSEFLLENSHHGAAGKVVSTGVALTEAGEVKTIQQVDLIV